MRPDDLCGQADGPGDLIVGTVEEVLQFLPGERPLVRCLLVLLGVPRGIPLEAHLGRVSSKQPFAQRIPPVSGVDEVPAEHPDGVLVRPHRGLPQVVLGSQIAEELVDMLHRPPPRHLVAVRHESTDQTFAAIDGGWREIPGQLLPAPTREHLFQDLICRVQVAHLVQGYDSSELVDRQRTPPPDSTR